MTDTHTSVIEQPQPSRHAIQRKTASAPGKVTGKLALAIKHIIEHGAEMDEAATHAGLTTRAVRLALEKPHVIQWMKAEREVFRAFICAQNISALADLRDKSGNAMAQLGAIKVLEQLGDDPQTQAGSARSPGFVIVVNASGHQDKPLIELSHSPRSEG